MTTGSIEQIYLDAFGENGLSATREILRTIDRELASLAQRIDKMEADNANMDGLRAMDDAIAREREARGRAGTVFWAPVTADDPPADGDDADYLLVTASGLICIGQRRRSGDFAYRMGRIFPTHFARLVGPKR